MGKMGVGMEDGSGSREQDYKPVNIHQENKYGGKTGGSPL